MEFLVLRMHVVLYRIISFESGIYFCPQAEVYTGGAGRHFFRERKVSYPIHDSNPML